MIGYELIVLKTLISLDGANVWYHLWVEEDGQRNRLDRLFTGRVKLQDDPIASAHAVLHDAIQQLESALEATRMDPLF